MPADVELIEQSENEQVARQNLEHAVNNELTRSGRISKVGRSAARRQKALQGLRKRLDRETRRNSDGLVEGPLRPCTLVNFNPIPLVAEIEGRRLTVPAPGHSQERFQYKVTYGGRKYTGAYMCFQNPIMYTPVTGHEVDDVLQNVDVAKTDVKYFSPHAIGCAFWHLYNSPHTKLVGGILLFDQEPRALSAASLERTKNRIWVPERILIEDATEFTYTLREADLEEELERIFETQLEYCNTIIQNAHTLWSTNEPAQQAMITNTDRDWARFAHDMRYGLTDLPAWVTTKLRIGSKGVGELRKCPYCQKQAQDPGALFCHGCNAPYDAYAAFMAGRVVPMGYLELLPDEQFEEVAKILEQRALRRSRLAGAEVPAEPVAAPQLQRKLTGAAAKSAAAKAAKAEQ